MSSSIKIDDNVPLPKLCGRASRKWPLRDLKVGQSFLAAPLTQGQYSGMYTQARVLKIKIATRKEADGFRIWRTA